MGATQIDGGTFVLAVLIGGEIYALPLSSVEEVLPALPIEPLPQPPDAVRGVVFVRGRLIPVIDAAQRLGIARERPLEPPIITMRLDERWIGIEVDEVLDLVDLASHPALAGDTRASPGPDPALPGAASATERRESVMVAAVHVDGQTIRLLDARGLGAPGLLWEHSTFEKRLSRDSATMTW